MNHEDFPNINSATKYKEVEEIYIPDFVPLTEATLNLENELLAQYNRARKLLHDSTYDSTIPLNQKAQAVNSATTIIGALIKSQAELYSLERIKKIEAILLETLRDFPTIQADFLVKYKEKLGD